MLSLTGLDENFGFMIAWMQESDPKAFKRAVARHNERIIAVEVIRDDPED